MRAPAESARLHGLDTLRGLAVVFVVLLHAGIPYMVRPLPHLVWPAVDCFPCLFVDGPASAASAAEAKTRQKPSAMKKLAKEILFIMMLPSSNRVANDLSRFLIS